MKCENDADVDRDPRQIEKRGWPKPGEKVAYGVEVAKRLQPVTASRDTQRQAHETRVNATAQRCVNVCADADEDARSNEIEYALDCQ
jgi:hypothetical protein